MIGYILKLIRVANNNMSTKDVAKMLDVSSSHISLIEKGDKKPSLTMLKKISSVYNIPLSEILLFDEIQEQKGLNYQQTLKMILEYYVAIDSKNVVKISEEHDMNFVKKLK